MSEKGKTDFLVLKADFFGLFPEKRPWCGSKIDLKIPGLYLWNQPSSRPFEQDIVNEFFFKPQFHPIMIIRQPIQNAYIFSHAGTPNKIWRNIQWNLISWNFSGFKKNKIKLTKRTLLSFTGHSQSNRLQMPVENSLFRMPCFNGLSIPWTAIVRK